MTTKKPLSIQYCKDDGCLFLLKRRQNRYCYQSIYIIQVVIYRRSPFPYLSYYSMVTHSFPNVIIFIKSEERKRMWKIMCGRYFRSGLRWQVKESLLFIFCYLEFSRMTTVSGKRSLKTVYHVCSIRTQILISSYFSSATVTFTLIVYFQKIFITLVSFYEYWDSLDHCRYFFYFISFFRNIFKFLAGFLRIVSYILYVLAKSTY